MTIKQLHEIAPAEQEIYISEYGAVRPLNRNSDLEMIAYGDYSIEAVEARNHNELEITIKMQPIKEGRSLHEQI